MTTNLQTLANSQFGVGLGLAAGQCIPPVLSYPLIKCAAKLLSRWENSGLVQSVRRNQQIVRGEHLTSLDLQKAVEEVFIYAGRCFIDLYYNLKNPAALQHKVLENDSLQRLITLSRDKNFGAFVVVPHMSNFDLMLLAGAARGFKTKVLTFAKPTNGYQLQNNIRATSGLEIMPVSKRAHINALNTMRNGGFVLTAIDRPISSQARKLNFFGRPSPLPDGYVRMALRADVPVMVAAVHMNKDGLYQLKLSDPVPMIRMTDPVKEIRYNAEKILRIIENYIRCHPSQWQMYYPVWPDENPFFEG